jgi:hypothetical protein
VQISADGTQRSRIVIPAPKSSSVAFGGPDYKDLYVTTAGGAIRETDGILREPSSEFGVEHQAFPTSSQGSESRKRRKVQ